MKTKKEMLGIAVKNGVAYGVVSLVAILFALCVLIEVVFELLMSLTTKLREKTMILCDLIAKTFKVSAIGVTTQKLWMNLEKGKDKIIIWLERLGL